MDRKFPKCSHQEKAIYGGVSIFPLVLFLILSLTCRAQNQIDTLVTADTITNLSSNLSRLGINTYALSSQAQSGTLGFGKHHLRGTLLQQHIYNTAQVGSNKFVTADFINTIDYQYRINNYWRIGTSTQVLDYVANKNRFSQVGSGMSLFYPISGKQKVYAKTYGQVLSDKRADINNYGPGYEATMIHEMQWDSSLATSVYGQYWQADIKPRQHQAYMAHAIIEKAFSAEALTFLRVGYRGRKIEDYLSMGDGLNIQSILSDTLTIETKLNYSISTNWVLRSINSLTIPNRSFDYRTYTGNTLRQNSFYKQNEWDLRETLTRQSGNLFFEERFEYQYRDRAYGVKNNLNLIQTEYDKILAQERVKDITEATQAWYTTIRYIPNDRHEIGLTSVAQLLRVDTRSEENNQDRDEVLYAGELDYKYYWTKQFRTVMKTSGSFKHLVYITSSQSVENFTERILRFEPSFLWIWNKLTLSGNYSLFVTYHVRDFETEQGKNRSNRILLTNISGRYTVNKNYALQLDVLRRENRLSQLNWKKFAESPIDTVVIWDFTAKLQRSFTSLRTNLRFDLGYRTFRQSRSNTTGINEGGGSKLAYVSNIILQHGPVSSLSVQLKNGFNLSAEIWIQSTAIYNDYQKTNTSYTGPATTTAELDVVQRNFFPNFNLNINWLINRRKRV
jgi:hypothetical protein